MHGLGKYTYAELGDQYVGEFKRDTMHGQGTYKHANGDIYSGEFVSVIDALLNTQPPIVNPSS
jgi:hypothetical protein